MSIARLFRFARRFVRDTRGAVSLEFALMMPALFLTLAGSYVYFDGYRQSTTNLKAAYTVSDLLSRETNVIDNDYLDAMVDLLRFLTRPDDNISLRVTLIYWSDQDNRYYVDWSAKRGFSTVLTNNDMASLETKLPVLADGDRAILVETRTYYNPDFNVGMTQKELYNFVVTRPRFAPQIVYQP
ncbi:MAG: TadE/TadG family type IV pilus assembly protein [Marinibacterium sp.]